MWLAFDLPHRPNQCVPWSIAHDNADGMNQMGRGTTQHLRRDEPTDCAINTGPLEIPYGVELPAWTIELVPGARFSNSDVSPTGLHGCYGG